MKKQLYITRVQSTAEMIDNMVGAAREITRATFLKNCDCPYDELTVSWDNHIKYFKSKYDGKTCYFVEHSRIEYVFI